jgi:hypothetical protein
VPRKKTQKSPAVRRSPLVNLYAWDRTGTFNAVKTSHSGLPLPTSKEHLMTNAEINRRVSEGIHRPDIDDIYDGPNLSEAAGLIKIDLLVKNWTDLDDTEFDFVSLT